MSRRNAKAKFEFTTYSYSTHAIPTQLLKNRSAVAFHESEFRDREQSSRNSPTLRNLYFLVKLPILAGINRGIIYFSRNSLILVNASVRNYPFFLLFFFFAINMSSHFFVKIKVILRASVFRSAIARNLAFSSREFHISDQGKSRNFKSRNFCYRPISRKIAGPVFRYHWHYRASAGNRSKRHRKLIRLFTWLRVTWGVRFVFDVFWPITGIRKFIGQI